MIIPVSSVKSRKRIFRSCKRNFIGVIVDQRNNMNHIETQHGLLKGWFTTGHIKF